MRKRCPRQVSGDVGRSQLLNSKGEFMRVVDLAIERELLPQGEHPVQRGRRQLQMGDGDLFLQTLEQPSRATLTLQGTEGRLDPWTDLPPEFGIVAHDHETARPRGCGLWRDEQRGGHPAQLERLDEREAPVGEHLPHYGLGRKVGVPRGHAWHHRNRDRFARAC